MNEGLVYCKTKASNFQWCGRAKEAICIPIQLVLSSKTSVLPLLRKYFTYKIEINWVKVEQPLKYT